MSDITLKEVIGFLFSPWQATRKGGYVNYFDTYGMPIHIFQTERCVGMSACTGNGKYENLGWYLTVNEALEAFPKQINNFANRDDLQRNKSPEEAFDNYRARFNHPPERSARLTINRKMYLYWLGDNEHCFHFYRRRSIDESFVGLFVEHIDPKWFHCENDAYHFEQWQKQQVPV